MIDCGVTGIFAAAVPDLASCQNHRVRIIAYAKSICSVDSRPLIFALTNSTRIQIGIRIGALANACAGESCGIDVVCGRILAAAQTGGAVHLSVVEVLALTLTSHMIDNSVICVFTTAVPDLTSCQNH